MPKFGPSYCVSYTGLQVLVCVLVCSTLNDKLLLYSCVNTECQVLVCVPVCLTLSAMCSSVFLYLQN